MIELRGDKSMDDCYLVNLIKMTLHNTTKLFIKVMRSLIRGKDLLGLFVQHISTARQKSVFHTI